jgi:hypothetical protein
LSQHDFSIANQTASSARTDINNALQALASLSSGADAPSTTYANQLWYETDTKQLKMRNEADDAWITLLELDQTNDRVEKIEAVDFNALSDANLKRNVCTLENALDLVGALRGVRFDWAHNNKPSVGLIAQEVQQIIPSLVHQTEANLLSVSYQNIVAVLIEAVKELTAKVTALENGQSNKET